MHKRTNLTIAIVLLAASAAWAIDTDNDGVDDVMDVCCNTPAGVAVDATGRPLGDVDADCDVDLADFAILANNLTGAFTDGPCPTCSDGMQNGDETGVDCGGTVCPPCGLPNGDPCTADSDCTSNFCRDSYCCDQNCSTSCRSCALAGFEGQCTFIPTGQDPDDECVDPAVCNGIGNCASGLGTVCGGDNECLSGFCRDGVCCDQNCGGTCRACDLPGTIGLCMNVMAGQDPDNECTGAQVCDGAGSCLHPLGDFCTSPSQCLSGFCVDNRCCDSFCGGTCESCDVTGSEGTCSFIPDGQDPDDECGFPFTACDGTGSCG